MTERKEVSLAFKTGQSVKEDIDYLLTQRLDPITDKPFMSINGRYWTKSGGFIEFPAITDMSVKKACSFAIIDGYALKCKNSSLPKGFFVCANSFLHNAGLTVLEIPLSTYVDKYDAISAYYKTLPKSSSEGLSFNGKMIPHPLQKTFPGVPSPSYGSSVSCWSEKVSKDTSMPVHFLCNSDEFERCESSESIILE